MTQRTEPSVGSTSAFDFLGFGGKKATVKTPDQLVNEALQGFKDESKSHLGRVAARFKELLA